MQEISAPLLSMLVDVHNLGGFCGHTIDEDMGWPVTLCASLCGTSPRWLTDAGRHCRLIVSYSVCSVPDSPSAPVCRCNLEGTWSSGRGIGMAAIVIDVARHFTLGGDHALGRYR